MSFPKTTQYSTDEYLLLPPLSGPLVSVRVPLSRLILENRNKLPECISKPATKQTITIPGIFQIRHRKRRRVKKWFLLFLWVCNFNTTKLSSFLVSLLLLQNYSAHQNCPLKCARHLILATVHTTLHNEDSSSSESLTPSQLFSIWFSFLSSGKHTTYSSCSSLKCIVICHLYIICVIIVASLTHNVPEKFSQHARNPFFILLRVSVPLHHFFLPFSRSNLNVVVVLAIINNYYNISVVFPAVHYSAAFHRPLPPPPRMLLLFMVPPLRPPR